MHGGGFLMYVSLCKIVWENIVMCEIVLYKIKLVMGKVIKVNFLFNICELLWLVYFVCF